MVAAFSEGLLQGEYASFLEDGTPLAKVQFRKGLLHGKAVFFRKGRPASTQTWKDGVLAEMDGVQAHPLDLESLRTKLPRILGPPQEPPLSPKDDREAALRLLKAYRFVCGVPYEDLVLSEELNRYAEAAARLCARLGRLDHNPPNPGLPEAEYRMGQAGADKCNLSQEAPGRAACASIDGYMDDSDPSNIDRVGHRRWCLNPCMLKTGIGVEEGYSALWAMDASRAKIPAYEVIAFPPSGWVPLRFFKGSCAWSLSPSPQRLPLPSKERLRVRVYPLEGGCMRAAAPLPLEPVILEATAGIASGPCLIFRPEGGVEVAHGARYWVEVEGLKPGGVLKYLVDFVDLEQGGPKPADLPEGELLPLLPPAV